MKMGFMKSEQLKQLLSQRAVYVLKVGQVKWGDIEDEVVHMGYSAQGVG